MKSFTITYKDILGRTNKAVRYGKDSNQAEEKFNVLYPDCRILNIE